MEPVNINNLLSLEDKLDDLEFRRVICKGVFDEKKSIYVGPRSRSISGVTENGHYVITPLMPIPGLPDRYFPVKLDVDYTILLSAFCEREPALLIFL